MHYGNNALQGATFATDCIGAPGELPRVLERINALHAGMSQLCDDLRLHADRVYGARPEAANTTQPVPVRCGLIGEIEDALDRLDQTQADMAEQVGRAANLSR